jgi:putative ABC transport system permease protein
VGRSLTLDGIPHSISGVLPASFQFPPAGDGEVWLLVDYTAQRMSERFNHWLRPIARLRDGVTREAAEADLAQVMGRLAVAYPESNRGQRVVAVSLREEVVGGVRPILLALLVAVSLMLLIACANVASLYLARALVRRRELAIRVALGASRGRVARQVIVEGLLLGLIGGIAGAMLARLGASLLVRAIPEAIRASLPSLETGALDWGTVVLAVGIALLAGTAFGIVSAVAVPFGAPSVAIGGGARTGSDRRGNRFRDALVIGEIALTLVLLAGAGLMTRSLVTLLRIDPGFAADRVMTMRIALAGPSYQTPESQQRFFESLLDRIVPLAGVETAGAVSNLPLNAGGTNTFRVEGIPEPDPAHRPEAVVRGVAGAYFEAMGISLVAGRVFGTEARNGTPSVVMSQSLARQLFGSASALGRRLRFYAFPDSAWEIRGVVGDVKTGTLDAPAPPTLYFSHLQAPQNRMSLAVRTAGRPELLAGALRGEVAALDRELPVYAVSTMEEQISSSPAVFFRRFPLVLLAAFALAALVLAMVGVYGVISYALTQRTREFGVRLALGAAPGSLVRLLIRRGALLGLAGAGAGLAAAIMGTRLLATILYGVTPTDPATLLGTSGLILLVAIAASWLAAWRATRIDPGVSLRAE